ncbi:MAG: epimerase transport system membrane fusion protein [Paracoccaceae bacterium]|jgi:epimerase transport system membrane fusion protein
MTDAARINYRRPAFLGVLVLFCAVAGLVFSVWRGAQLDGIVVRGVIVDTTAAEEVVPVVGGVVKALLAQDGEVVARGAPLILLDRSVDRENATIHRDRLRDAQVRKLRLIAELSDAETLEWPAGLAQDSTANAARAQQEALFTARQQARDALTAQTAEELGDLTGAIAALQAEIGAAEGRMADLQNTTTDALNRQNRLADQIARAGEAIVALENQVRTVRQKAVEDNKAFVFDLTGQIEQADEAIVAFQDILALNRAMLESDTVVAPVAGVFNVPATLEKGRLIAAGQSVAGVTPQGDKGRAVLYVDRWSVGRIASGQGVTVIDQETGRLLGQGNVDGIAQQLTMIADGQGAFYEVAVNFESAENHKGLLPDLPVQGRVSTEQISLFGALMAPLSAVFRDISANDSAPSK